jgi:hypothetical protein
MITAFKSGVFDFFTLSPYYHRLITSTLSEIEVQWLPHRSLSGRGDHRKMAKNLRERKKEEK